MRNIRWTGQRAGHLPTTARTCDEVSLPALNALLLTVIVDEQRTRQPRWLVTVTVIGVLALTATSVMTGYYHG